MQNLFIRSTDEHARAGFNWWEAWGEIKIEGFGGRPLLVGGLGPWAPCPPKSGLGTYKLLQEPFVVAVVRLWAF